MAYLTINLSAGAYNPSTNSTSVSATVSITWDTSESYNQMNQSGTLTIGDNYSTTFSTNFNASRTESGTQILGGGTTSIKHDSTGGPIQVVARASGDGRSASNFITLPGGTPSGSGGSGGNESGGGEDEGGGSGGEYVPDYSITNLRIQIEEGEHTTVRVKQIGDASGGNYGNGIILKDGDVISFISYYSEYPIIQFAYMVDDGYIIDVHTVDGQTFYSGEEKTFRYSGTGTYTCKVKTTAKKVAATAEGGAIAIDDGSTLNLYESFIDNKDTWELYIPYITIQKYNSWDGLFQGTIEEGTQGLNLRSEANTDSSKLITIPENTLITVTDITIGGDGKSVWCKTSYDSYTGWCNSLYVLCNSYAQVSNQLGTYLFTFDSNNNLVQQDYFYNPNSEILIFKDTPGTSNGAFIVYDNQIWGKVVYETEDNSGTKVTGYVKIEDLTFLQEKFFLEWVPYGYSKKSKEKKLYIYKDGVMYSPLSNGFSVSTGSLVNVNNTLRYDVPWKYRENKTKVITKDKLEVSKYKYLCLKVGNINEYVPAVGSLEYDESTYSTRAVPGFYIGLNNGGTTYALNYAMYLTQYDSNTSVYVDLSGVDLFGEYYFGFGTEEIGTGYYSYIKEIWLTDELDSNMVKKDFTYTLKSQGAVG